MEHPNDTNGDDLSHIPNSSDGPHILRVPWTLWFSHRSPGTKIENYDEYTKRIADFDTVEHFWHVYAHLKRPDQVKSVSNYHLFKKGVRPVWEDEANVHGGKWTIRLRKGVCTRYWEDLLLAIIGDAFYEVNEDFCGLVLSVRSHEDILSVWTRNDSHGSKNLYIKKLIRTILHFPADTIVEYYSHRLDK